MYFSPRTNEPLILEADAPLVEVNKKRAINCAVIATIFMALLAYIISSSDDDFTVFIAPFVIVSAFFSLMTFRFFMDWMLGKPWLVLTKDDFQNIRSLWPASKIKWSDIGSIKIAECFIHGRPKKAISVYLNFEAREIYICNNYGQKSLEELLEILRQWKHEFGNSHL